MNTFTAIEARRSVKRYDPDFMMPEADVKRLLSMAVMSPTAFNIQNWRFVLVRDPGLRRKIREIAWDQPQIEDASILIVICADLKAWEKEPERYWRNTSPEVREMVLPMIDKYYRGREQVQRDEAMRSCGLAAQTIMLAAKAMGYDSCPMDGFDFEAAGRLINLPQDHVISMFVAVGKAVHGAQPRPGQLPLSEVVIDNSF